MRRLILPILLLCGLTLLRSEPALARPATQEIDAGAGIEAALDEAVERSLEFGLAYVVFEIGIDRLRISSDGEWAMLWLSALDRGSGEVVAMEPWPAIGRFDGSAWTVYLPSDPEFAGLLARVPAKILPESERLLWQDLPGLTCDTSGTGPFTGYRLPWPAGQTLYLTQSIYHTLGWGSGNNPTFSMIHSFDFSSSPAGLFNLSASRPGKVKFFHDSQPNNDPTSPGNYIVLEDTGTNPTSYQLYLHLAQGSIPAALKTVGAPVQQGQFIGVADDTGVSTNHHLHFQVHTEVSWWGCSVDVRFSDVAINGGRPRLPIEAQNHPEYGSTGQTTYVSGNTPPPSSQNFPGGGILSPSAGQTIGSATIALSGYAFDFTSGIATAQFAYNAGAGWTPVGSVFPFSGATGTVFFNGAVDVCSAGIPDGPVTLGIKALNDDGNAVFGGLAIPIILDADCTPPPPACQPDSDEVALFAQPNYAGSCQVLDVEEHVQSLTARSLLVGEDVSITLYFSSLLRARSQTFTAHDPNLSDDRASLDLFGSARVRLRSQAPLPPAPAWPANGETLPLETGFSLVWHDGGGSEEFQARVTGASGTVTAGWSSALFWDPGPLAPGGYTWEVRARNAAGESAWSAAGAFSIAPPDPGAAASPVQAPLVEDFEGGANGWFGTGFWNLLADGGVSFNGLRSWWYGGPPNDYDGGDYNSGTPNAGSLTSPPVLIPSTGYYLRYYSRYETETAGVHWDRRRVLISADGGPFTEITQLSEDVQGQWQRSPYFSLDSYAGQTIRVRFSFETMDAQFNSFPGWLIDQVTIDTAAPPSCPAANEPDNTPLDATPLTPGSPVSGWICPFGDVDFYAFNANAGDILRLDIDAQSLGSPLDAYAFLLHADGRSVIAENDDEEPGVLLDPLLVHPITESGTYYIKIRAYDHPAGAGGAHAYTLTIELDAIDPVIASLTPSVPLVDIGSLPATVVLTAAASDSGSGLASVEFFYHSPNWQDDEWVSLGIDLSPSNGWTATWNTALLPAQPGMALLAVARDQAGNLAALGLWDLFPLPLSVYLPLGTR